MRTATLRLQIRVNGEVLGRDRASKSIPAILAALENGLILDKLHDFRRISSLGADADLLWS